jgi:hypothetical protein
MRRDELIHADQTRNSSFLKACIIVIAVGLLNFLIFVAGAIHLGGDAVNGEVEGGRYYLFGVRAESGRKVYVEVSKPVFTYSRRHVYSIFVIWPLVMVAGLASNDTKSD